MEKNGVGHVDPDRLQRNINTVTKAFNLPQTPKAEDIYTGKFVPPASERMLKF